MQKITPFLWFNNNLEEAADVYVALFGNSKILSMHRAPGAAPGEKGRAFTATFSLGGQEFYALNGGPMYSFSPATSFFVECETGEDVDRLWKGLGEGGTVFMDLNKYPFSEKYGWVQDRFGISWQLMLTKGKQKISPCLMFVKEVAGKAEQAIQFYSRIFKDSETQMIARYEEGEGAHVGSIKHASFSLDGVTFKAMDSHMEHLHVFSPAISFFVNCTTQEEVDFFWDKLSEGGKTSRCGWLDDKYGVTWQIVPDTLGKLMYDKDRIKAKRVMDAMMKMTKLEIKGLEDAYNEQ